MLKDDIAGHDQIIVRLVSVLILISNFRLTLTSGINSRYYPALIQNYVCIDLANGSTFVFSTQCHSAEITTNQ